MANVNSTYGAADIKVLEGLKAVQKRPAMYVAIRVLRVYTISSMKW